MKARLNRYAFGLAGLAAANAMDCTLEALNAGLPSGISISWAYHLSDNSTFMVPEGDVFFSTSPTNLQACCALQVEVPGTNNDTYNFGMFLPDKWNGRFLTAGNAGFAGGVNWLSMGDGLGYGFAVMSSDLGHNSSASDASWAYHQPGKLADWGYRALHGSVVYAKNITECYYGSNIQYSYYRGCSTGGRQGLKEVEMFPEDFDGVVAGAPAWWTKHLQLWNGWVGLLNTPVDSPHHVPQSLFATLGAEVLRQCDPQDGVVDNIIMNPERCFFRPETLLCGAINSTNTPNNASLCFTPAQLDTVYKWYNDYVTTNQTFIFPSFQRGSEWQWATPIGLLGDNEPSALGTDYVKYMLGLGPDWSWEDWDTDMLLALSEQINPGNATADNFDISPFAARGGKLLHYHGWADGSIATGSSVYFYEHVARALSEKQVELDDFYRFFLIPGMGHCFATSDAMKAPWVIGGDGQAGSLGTGVSGVPGFRDAQHDVLLAVMAWVENGTSPKEIVATKFVNDTTHDQVYSQRPLCKYPEQAMYKGTGNVLVADSWECKSLY